MEEKKKPLVDNRTQELVRGCLESLENLSLKEEQSTSEKGLEHHPFLGLIKNWFFTWLPKWISLRETAPSVSQIAKNKFANYSKGTMKKELKFFPHETITSHYIAIYCDLISGETTEEEIKKDLDNAMELVNVAIKNDFITLKMMEAYTYLHSTVEALHLTKTMNESKVNGVLEHIRALSENVPEETSAICTLSAAKSIFLGAFRQGKAEMEVLEEMVRLEPNVLDWKILFLFGSRIERKQMKVGPSPEEKEELLKCLDMKKEHPVVKLLTVGYLTDLIRDRDNKIRFPFGLKEMQFFQVEDILDHVRALAEEIMKDMAYSTKANLLLADAVTSGLPYPLRDYPNARKYLKSALTSNPHSSKANHKMGVVLIFEKKYLEAEGFCKKAFETDKRNFPAIIDYIQILLREPIQNASELEKVFKFYAENETWKGEQEAVISTYKGIWKFISGDKKEAVKLWLEANEKEKTEPIQAFKRLGEAQRRFQWDGMEINLENFKNYIENCQRDSSLKLDKPRLEALVKELKSISITSGRNHDNWRGSDNPNRGRGFPGRFHGNRRGHGNRRF